MENINITHKYTCRRKTFCNNSTSIHLFHFLYWYIECVLLTEHGESEAHHSAEGGPHGPAVLQGGNRVHGDPEHGHQQLTGDQVHQQQVELSPQLQHYTVQVSTVQYSTVNIPLYTTVQYIILCTSTGSWENNQK